MTTATAADYSWIRSPSSLFKFAMEVGYTLTLVQGVSPEKLYALAGAEASGRCHGFDELVECHWELLDEFDHWPDAFLTGTLTLPSPAGTWTLALEFGGGLGTRDSFMEPLSYGTRAVSHSSNGGKPMDFFHWYENGLLRTTFEWPGDRTGTTPDDLNQRMREVGLNPSGDQNPDVDRKAAVLALTERLTGVRLTEELLRQAEYITAVVPEEQIKGSGSLVVLP
ncbi:DUF6461 domain-containing protein [Streptomyces sp. NPDC029216]|uniref:DUF6461 domain-containing protein n=1 Tax=Streptomyces sp. NPDC029216 TaxID=3154701 RepID=UPI0033C1AF24